MTGEGWDLEGRPKLHITVTNDAGEVVYRTWNEDAGWTRVELLLGQTERVDGERATVMGETIGKSLWHP